MDKRADVWAFGAVLFEMLAGQRAFAGDDVTDTMVAVLSQEPNWTCLHPDLPRQVRVLIERCLQKDLRQRLPHIAVARQELEAPPEGEVPLPVAPRRGRWASLGAAVAVLATGMAAAAAFTWWQPVARPHAIVSTIAVPELLEVVGASFAMSPDGQRLVFVAPDAAGRTMLWVRPRHSGRPTPGTSPSSPAAP